MGEDRIAYQILGEGPPDLVMTSGSFGHVDLAWEDPGIALFLRTLASFSRLIQFDRRGTGASDPLPLDSLPPWESYAQDLVAVLDEVGSQQAALLAQVDASPMAIFFAGTKPERTSALVLAKPRPGVAPTTTRSAFLSRPPRRSWPRSTSSGAPRPSSRCRCPAAPATRGSASGSRGPSGSAPAPGPVQAFLRAAFEMDASSILPLIQAPTLVLHRRDFQFVSIAHGRYLAEHIPGARLVELPGTERRCSGRPRNSPWTRSSGS